MKNKMNPTVFIYLVASLCFLLPLGGYFLTVYLGKKKGSEKPAKIYGKALAIAALVSFFLYLFFVPTIITAKAAEADGYYREGVGLVGLIGVPYGENQPANFFALCHLALFLTASGMFVVLSFFSSGRTTFLKRFITLPILALSFIGLFDLANLSMKTPAIGYKAVFIALTSGLSLAGNAISVIKERHQKIGGAKNVVFALAYFLFALIAFLPMDTFAATVPTDVIIFHKAEHLWRIYDFSFLHRLYLYIGIAYFVALYFVLSGADEGTKRAILLIVSIGSISSFFTSYGFEGIFDVSHGYRVMPTRLPIHLCHTALFVTPLCIAFKWKRLFYFTYFINVFGAMMAMVFPNNGETQNMFDPEVMLFWYNHMTALCMPLLTVALGVFARPKMKQMGHSLAYFSIYFILIMVANGWLSNYVPGYNPNVLGSGTDYLFINNDYILGIFGPEAKKMLNVKLIFPIGNLTVVLYPLYQSLFFVGYAGIAFLMWYVYALFYRIEDGHRDLHYHYAIARQRALDFREARRMREENKNENKIASLVFSGFAKKYGTSPTFAVDHIDLRVEAGDVFGFLGPNGAGKSTCIKSAIGIQPITEGRIEVCGFDIENEPVQAKTQIGYVPDHYALYEKLTGREYINYVADIYGVSSEDREKRIDHYVKLFELEGAFDSRMQTYSHGMKQKIAIMAALVHNPKVWILDEPLTGLDPQSVFQVKQTMIHHAQEGNVVFFSSHIIDVVERLCTKIAIILNGKIVFQGTMKEVEKNHPEGLEKFYMSFLGGENGQTE